MSASYRQKSARNQQLMAEAPFTTKINVNMPGFRETEALAEDALINPEDIDMNEIFPDLMVTQQKMIPPFEPEKEK